MNYNDASDRHFDASRFVFRTRFGPLPHYISPPLKLATVASTAGTRKLCFAAEVQSTDRTLGRESRIQSDGTFGPAAGYTFVAISNV